jgi:hypothetical protein
MPTLKLKQLTCNKTEDNIGSDQPYLHVNGEKIWGPVKAKAGDSLIVNEQYQFKSNATVELWELDIDPDDHLGAHVVNHAESGTGESTAHFTGSGADYLLTYEVTD